MCHMQAGNREPNRYTFLRKGTSGDHGAEVRAWVFKHPILIGAIVGKYAVDGKVNVIKKSRPLMESP